MSPGSRRPVSVPRQGAVARTPRAAQAANQGDKVALEIFEAAGRAMAVQMNTLLARLPRAVPPHITLCGGAWKAHPRMLETFQAEVQARYPDMRVHRPWFEHMAAGPMQLALRKGLSPLMARRAVAAAFTQEIISEEEWE